MVNDYYQSVNEYYMGEQSTTSDQADNEYYLEYLYVHLDFTMCAVDEKAYQLFRELIYRFK